MNTVPESLPTLAAGSHSPDDGEACLMEYVALLNGEVWSDSPACTHPVLACVARTVNDRVADRNRHLLVPLIGRLFGTAPPDDQVEAKRLNVGLAVYSAKSVFHLVDPASRARTARRIAAAERFLTTGESPSAVAGSAAQVADAVAAAEAAWYAAGYAVGGGAAADAAGYAADAARAADVSGGDAQDKAMVDSLSALITEYDRLTGRAEHREVSNNELVSLRNRVAESAR